MLSMPSHVISKQAAKDYRNLNKITEVIPTETISKINKNIKQQIETNDCMTFLFQRDVVNSQEQWNSLKLYFKYSGWEVVEHLDKSMEYISIS
jgi:hypothetical protein